MTPIDPIAYAMTTQAFKVAPECNGETGPLRRATIGLRISPNEPEPFSRLAAAPDTCHILHRRSQHLQPPANICRRLLPDLLHEIGFREALDPPRRPEESQSDPGRSNTYSPFADIATT